MDTPLFYSALFVHIMSLITGFGAVIVIDTCGLLWIIGKVKLSLISKVAKITQPLIWIGWIGMVISGAIMITFKGYIDSLTTIKLFFVAMIGLNGIFLHYIKKTIDRLGNISHVPAILNFRITLATIISQVGWWGAIVIGFLHRHIEHYIDWPDKPVFVITIIICVLAGITIVGETAFRSSNR